MDGDNLQIIRRSSLATESSSRDSLDTKNTTLDIQAQYQQRLRSLFEVTQDSSRAPLATTSKSAGPAIDEHIDNDEAIEFRLFASDQTRVAAEHTTTTPKIKLGSLEPRNNESRFLLPRRPDAYYFSGELTGQKAQEYQYAAVTSESILKYATIKWRGCELPWRVETIKAPKVPSGPTVRADPPSVTRKRHGKRRRIILRKRFVEANERETKAIKSKEENAEAEKEKRNRKNRERKIKRRQKERDRKATERQGDG